MKASEYKAYKGLRKESLRDNMTDIEVLLTDLGEIATRDIATSERPQGFNENMKVAKRGGQVASVFRENFILSILGAMAGLLLGKALHAFVIGVIQTDEIMFGRGLPLWVYAVGFVMTLIFSMLVNGIMFFRLKKISMVESLKSVE